MFTPFQQLLVTTYYDTACNITLPPAANTAVRDKLEAFAAGANLSIREVLEAAGLDQYRYGATAPHAPPRPTMTDSSWLAERPWPSKALSPALLKLQRDQLQLDQLDQLDPEGAVKVAALRAALPPQQTENYRVRLSNRHGWQREVYVFAPTSHGAVRMAETILHNDPKERRYGPWRAWLATTRKPRPKPPTARKSPFPAILG